MKITAITLFLLTCLHLVTFGQQVKKDTVQRDTIKNRFLPTGIRVGTDLIAILKSQTQNNFNGWEVNADVDLNRFYVAYDRGTWSRNYQSDSAQYANNGQYWRAGVDVNFLVKDPERNMFFVGFRYARSTFSEDLSISSYDKVWGKSNQVYANDNVHARWYELTTGLRVRMWKFIWMGYTARFKFSLKPSGVQAMLPHDVPGYGRTSKETYWGFNYQIFIRIPFRETPPLPPPRKKR